MEIVIRKINGSNSFLKFLSMFYKAYPELKYNKLILAGESFAGKYLPLYTYQILITNANRTKSK